MDIHRCQCQNCSDRHVGCHSTCESYRMYRQMIDEVNDIRRREEQSKKHINYVRFRPDVWVYGTGWRGKNG